MSTDQKGIFIQLIFFYITIISQEKGIFLEIEYRTRAIITRGLYTFYPLIEVQKRFFKGLFS